MKTGLSQMRLAEDLGVSLQTVREWEKGTKFPRLDRVPTLSRVLGVSPGHFFPELTDRPPQGRLPESWPDAVQDEGPETRELYAIERKLLELAQDVEKLRVKRTSREPES